MNARGGGRVSSVSEQRESGTASDLETALPSPKQSARRKLSAAAARRVALAAQGFACPRLHGHAGSGQIRDLVGQLGLLQLDSVNVFCRSHYMPVFSRLGTYDRSALDLIAAHQPGSVDRQLVEYWAHEASLIPIDLYPLLRWRMARADQEAWAPVVKLAREQPELVARTLKLVADQGPIRASATGDVRPARKPGQMWSWHDGKIALEYLFYAGRVAAAGRINFQRIYDLPERVLPAEVLGQPEVPAADAQRQLVRIAAKALGIATEPDLGDYFRLPRAASKARVAELAETGELMPVEVDDWAQPAYLWHAARQPRTVNARALLSPFDSLIWYRERTQRLFGFEYHVEIYTPAPKRTYGYYVLPFLLGDTLVARVDLKSDRKAELLLVQGAFAEEGAHQSYVAGELATELREVATWLGLSDVVVRPQGGLAAQLAAALR
jgi:uncharacterized protein